MRLFVALEIPSQVRERLTELIARLRAADSDSAKQRAKWVRAENLHVTLKFIGHVEDGKLAPIREALSQVHSDAAVKLGFNQIGFFPNERRPRVLFVGIEASPNLALIAKLIDQRLVPLGIPPETRDFTPHLTLARFDPPGISEKLRAATLQNAHTGFGALQTEEFHLIESKLKPTGAEYTTLQSFRFAAEA